MSRPVGRPRATTSEDIRANLLRIAARHLSEAGYAKTTFRAIARDADVTVGAVYYYFPTKVSLVEAIVEEVNRLILPVFVAVFDRTTLAERVETMLVSVTGAAPTVLGGVGNFLLVDAPRYQELQPICAAWVKSHEDVLARMVDDAIRSGEIPPDMDRSGLVDALRALLFGVSALFSAFPGRARGAAAVAGRIFANGGLSRASRSRRAGTGGTRIR